VNRYVAGYRAGKQRIPAFRATSPGSGCSRVLSRRFIILPPRPTVRG
jgi:hypothetical protein